MGWNDLLGKRCQQSGLAIKEDPLAMADNKTPAGRIR